MFVLPILFFSIFAIIFGSVSGGGGGAKAMRVIVVDQDDTDVSRRFVEAIDDQDALAVVRAPAPSDDDPSPAPFTREAARHDVRRGDHPVAIIVPQDFGATFGTFDPDAPPIEVIHDPANPIAAPTYQVIHHCFLFEFDRCIGDHAKGRRQPGRSECWGQRRDSAGAASEGWPLLSTYL